VEAQLCGGKEVIVVGGGKLSWPSCYVSGTDYKTGTYASQGPPAWLLLYRGT